MGSLLLRSFAMACSFDISYCTLLSKAFCKDTISLSRDGNGTNSNVKRKVFSIILSDFCTQRNKISWIKQKRRSQNVVPYHLKTT